MNDPTKEKKLLTVVIVSHNSRRFLRRCLHSIFKSWSLPDFEVILVDNASSDGTVHMVRKSFSHVEVIANRENLGFSRACNQAVKSVSSRYILFLNPDIEVEPGAIAGMIRKMESSERTAIVGGLIFDASGIPQHGARRQIPGLLAAFFHLSGLWRLFPRSAWVNRYAQSHASPFEEREVGAVSGAFMMIRRDVFILVGGFDEDYFLYGEDMDLCLSVSARGFAVLYSPDARALHHHRTSTRKKPVRATYHFYRSMALFYRKHYRQGWRKFTVPLVSLACGGMFLIQLLFGERIRLTGGVMRIEKTWMKFVFVVLDLLSVTGSWFLAIYVRYGEFKALPPFRDYRSYLLFMVIILIVTYGSLFYLRAYRLRPRAMHTALKSTVLVYVVLNLIFFYSKPIAFSRLVLLYFSLFLFCTMMLWRMCYHLLSMSRLGKGLYSRRIAVAGSGERVGLLLTGLRPDEDRYQLVGIVGKIEPGTSQERHRPFLGTYPELPEIVRNFSIDELILVEDDEEASDWLLVSSYLRGTGVRLRLLTGELARRLDAGTPLRLGDFPPAP